MPRAKRLTVDDCSFWLIVEQDDIEVRGNALASGDEDEDRAAEDEILSRLDSGDVWAWAFVRVRGQFCGLTAETSLGGCNYASESDFRSCDYYQSMVDEVLAILQEELETCFRLGIDPEENEDVDDA